MLKDLRQGGMVHFLERYILQRQVSVRKGSLRVRLDEVGAD